MAVIRSESGQKTENINRIVVLLPNEDVNEVKISRAIRSMALQESANVLLVSLARNSEAELPARRRLATILSLVRSPQITVTAQIPVGRSWIIAIEKVAKAGDRIVCPAEVDVPTGFNRSDRLPAVLSRELDLPVITLTGFYPEKTNSWIPILKRALFWIVTLTIFIGFFKLEIDVDLLAKGWMSQFILVVLILLEAGVIYMWSSILG